MTTWLTIVAIGAAVGFLGGMFGKGGSAIATPLLAAAGLPAIVAVAGPLPATIPATALAAYHYHRQGQLDRRLVLIAIAFGVPATIIGAVATRWIGGEVLIIVTDVVIAALGLRFFLRPHPAEVIHDELDRPLVRLAVVAVVAGLAGGLLANSGGFLLAPLFIAVVRLPIKAAFAASLAVSAVLAVPGTVVHAALGHIDWTVVAVFAAASIPLTTIGARVAMKVPSVSLERFYGLGLTVLGVVFLLAH